MIGLYTDFGESVYIGEMKGVIRSLCNDEIIDICHTIRRQSIVNASYIIERSYKFFPKDTIFVCVVDPGVGTNRREIVVRTKNYWFIAPDNGIVYKACTQDGILHTFVINRNSKYFKNISNTFHGRDIFAKTAALIRSVDINKFCDKSKRILAFDYTTVLKGDMLKCIVVDIDNFGNIVLSAKKEELGNISSILLGKMEIGFKKSYNFAKKGEMLCYYGSSNNLEISINAGDASKALKIDVGDTVCLRIKR